jgi:hypothetical protein
MSVPFTSAWLKAELTSDPASLGYSASVQSGADSTTAGLINAANYFVYQPIVTAQVLKWGSGNGVRYNVEAAATTSGPFASGQPKAISSANQGLALAVRDLLQGGYAVLDLTDPAIVGALASGAPYTPGSGTVSTPGLFDALVSAGILVDGSGNSLKDSLITVGKVAASRATVLWGYSFSTNPTGPTAVKVTIAQIAQALRG